MGLNFPNVVCDVDTLGGEPRIKYTRIGVGLLVNLKENGYDIAGIKKIYPQLCVDHINEAFLYYEQHREEIDFYVHNYSMEGNVNNQIEKYEHHGQLVTVRSDLKGKHREYCLCFRDCKYFHPSTIENCPIASALFTICCQHNVVTPVWECKLYEEKNGV